MADESKVPSCNFKWLQYMERLFHDAWRGYTVHISVSVEFCWNTAPVYMTSPGYFPNFKNCSFGFYSPYSSPTSPLANIQTPMSPSCPLSHAQSCLCLPHYPLGLCINETESEKSSPTHPSVFLPPSWFTSWHLSPLTRSRSVNCLPYLLHLEYKLRVETLPYFLLHLT